MKKDCGSGKMKKGYAKGGAVKSDAKMPMHKKMAMGMKPKAGKKK